MPSQHILTETRDHVLTIRMNRADKKNALTVDMYRGLTAAMLAAENDAQVRVIQFAGAETCFTAGNDILDFMQSPPSGESAPVFLFLKALAEATKPLVAVVAGPAIGVGTTMLLHCDLVFAAPSAKFQMPFVSLGLIPEAGSSLLLPRLVGHRVAAELLMLGEAFGPDKAKQWGIINEIYPEAELQGKSWERMQKLASQPPAAVRLTKALLKQEYSAVLRQTMMDEGRQFVARLTSPEAMEALTAFTERRKPDFSNLV